MSKYDNLSPDQIRALIQERLSKQSEILKVSASEIRDLNLLVKTVMGFKNPITSSMVDHIQATYENCLSSFHICAKFKEGLPEESYELIENIKTNLINLNKMHAKTGLHFKIFKIGDITSSPLVHLDSSFNIIDGSDSCAIKGDHGVSILWHKTHFEKGKDGKPFYKPWSSYDQHKLGYLNPYDAAYFNRYAKEDEAIKAASSASASKSASSSLTPEKDSKAAPVKDIGKKHIGSFVKAEEAAEVTPVGDIDPFADESAHSDVAGNSIDHGGCCTVM
jgi:hypothetical protein